MSERTETYGHDCGCETCPEHTSPRTAPAPADGGEREKAYEGVLDAMCHDCGHAECERTTEAHREHFKAELDALLALSRPSGTEGEAVATEKRRKVRALLARILGNAKDRGEVVHAMGGTYQTYGDLVDAIGALYAAPPAPVRVTDSRIERASAHDEIVTHGMTHIERLNDGTIYLDTGGEVFTLHAEKRGVLRWFPRDREWSAVCRAALAPETGREG